MKFITLMKNPSTLRDAIEEAMKEEFLGLDAGQVKAAKEKRREKIYKMCCEDWFKYGEYLRVEVNTITKTCTVIPSIYR
mgnify:CR=1 FL=1